MTRLTALKARQVIKGVQILGFQKVRQKGSHDISNLVFSSLVKPGRTHFPSPFTSPPLSITPLVKTLDKIDKRCYSPLDNKKGLTILIKRKIKGITVRKSIEA